MTDKDDIRELKADVKELREADAIEKNNRKWIHIVCRTSTIACGSILFWLGTVVYDKFPAVKAAIVAFIKADKGIS